VDPDGTIDSYEWDLDGDGNFDDATGVEVTTSYSSSGNRQIGLRVNDTDGFKILLEDGSWLLVRPSGTEPKMRVYAEAHSEERVAELLDAGRELVEPLV
jgi:phosphomannomutase